MPSNNIDINFDNSYSRLPENFYEKINPESVKDPKLIVFNNDLGTKLGIENTGSKETLSKVFSGNLLPDGSEPIALAYAGHQFGQFVPQLGDGRAILLGEVIDNSSFRRDIQLKGAGLTPFSRQGDGRAALGPVLREYIISEGMHALGISTTRSPVSYTHLTLPTKRIV